jgi:hypothetical protein
MSMIKEPEHLPVFYHIAKNAGTYVLSWMMMLCRKYNLHLGKHQIPGWSSKRIRRSIVLLKEGKQLTCCIHTPTDVATINNNFKKDKFSDEVTDYVDLEFFIDSINNGDVEVFSISVDPTVPGASIQRDAIEKIKHASKREHALNFTVLRDPFARSISLYHYIKGDKSKHEPTHDSIISANFLEYIQSSELEDSWLIRHLLDMQDSQVIEPRHFTLANEYLQYFRISDMGGVDELINNVFHGSYGILQSDVEPKVVATHINKNKTNKKLKFKFEDLESTLQQTFLDRTYWDRKLWEKYCKNANIT